MKKIILTLLSVSLFTVAFAQKFLPEIKKGTVLNCSAFVNGQEFPLTLTIKSMSAPVSIGWAVEGYGEGSFDMTDKALESATKMAAGGQPSLGATKLSEDETFCLISKTAFKALTDTKILTYGGAKFKIKTDDKPMKINGKEADVIHLVNEEGKVEYWVLNNPAFPLIVQSLGMQTDIVVSEIK